MELQHLFDVFRLGEQITPKNNDTHAGLHPERTEPAALTPAYSTPQ